MLRWINSQLGRIVSWAERTLQQEVNKFFAYIVRSKAMILLFSFIVLPPISVFHLIFVLEINMFVSLLYLLLHSPFFCITSLTFSVCLSTGGMGLKME